jgi:Domain of unknown function (DUF4412)
MRSILGCLCVGLGALSAAQAGVVVHMSTKGSADGAPKNQQVVYAQDGLLRVDKLDDQGRVQDYTLIRDGAIWEVDTRKHTFRKYDKNAMAAQQNEMSERMQTAMQNMPADKRAMFEQRMKTMQQETHDYELMDSGRSEHVGAYSCKIWQAVRDSKPITEYCVVPKGSLTGGDELVTATHKASSIAADVVSAAPQIARAISPMYKMYGKLDGFPVMTRHLSGGQAQDETVVTSIEKKSLPADQFAIPKGFTEVAPGISGADN